MVVAAICLVTLLVPSKEADQVNPRSHRPRNISTPLNSSMSIMRRKEVKRAVVDCLRSTKRSLVMVCSITSSAASPAGADAMADTALTDVDLNRLQLTTLQYYLHESNPANGLVRDKTAPGTPASIAAVGLALATLP